jgi:2-methylcitrate dehydratase PrpD
MLGELAPASIVARRFRPLGVLGPIGSAAAVATLCGGSPSELAAALSIAANAASGYGQGFVAGSIEPYVHAGYAARNGLLAAAIAMAGGTASPNSFEGPYGFFQTYGGEAGGISLPAEEHAITRLGTKKYAACLQNQESLELILERLPVPIEGSIRTVRLYRPATPNNGTASPGVGTEPPYLTMLQRQMSARFTAAAALLGRPVDDVRYFEAAGSDSQVAQLAARIELISTPEATVRIEVEMADGRTHRAGGDMSAALFPTSEEIRRRFRARAESVIGATAAEVEPLIAKLEQVPDVNELLILLRPQAA